MKTLEKKYLRGSNEKENKGSCFYTRDSAYGVRYRCKYCGKDNLGINFGDKTKMHFAKCPVLIENRIKTSKQVNEDLRAKCLAAANNDTALVERILNPWRISSQEKDLELETMTNLQLSWLLDELELRNKETK